MKPISHLIENRPWVAWIIFFFTIVLVFLIGLLASSVVERRAEAVFVNVPKTPISQFEPRNVLWG
jgi:nitrite reductase (cytochrome c-552)